jgi:hypothetical protein
VISATTVRAGEGWTITSFHSDIKVNADSSLLVKEDISVDFGTLQKHGIFRTIPLRFRFDDKQDRYYTLTISGVTDGTSRLMKNPSDRT